MSSKMKTDCFISMVAEKLLMLAYKNGYHVCSPIIAQSILESGWGKSDLSDVYNYFGMKANARWHGDYVEMVTQEEKPDGTRYTVTAKFRKYNSLMAGLQGYFEFISIDRYNPLRSATDYTTYCNALKECGYATSSSYANSLIRIIEQYKLDRYDTILQNLEKGI